MKLLLENWRKHLKDAGDERFVKDARGFDPHPTHPSGNYTHVQALEIVLGIIVGGQRTSGFGRTSYVLQPAQQAAAHRALEYAIETLKSREDDEADEDADEWQAPDLPLDAFDQ